MARGEWQRVQQHQPPERHLPERHQPPAEKGKRWKMFYATQVASGPPTFMIFANRTLSHQHTYRRYLENMLRSELKLPGVPIRLVIRQR